jgi:pimeloyl-ACP methyl ester carboxylesterase
MTPPGQSGHANMGPDAGRAPRSGYARLTDAVVHYQEWGDPRAEAVLCVPGFSRNSHDFDVLARVLSERFRVICVDLPGRGFSQWAERPEDAYQSGQYETQILELLEQLGVSTFCWVGTSLGGAIGIFAAGGRMRNLISHLVVNDIGPEPPLPAARDRIVEYLSHPPAFGSVVELEAYYREIYRPFGITRDDTWRAFTEHSARRREDGRFTPDYDPRAVIQWSVHFADFQLWPRWHSIAARVLVIHGVNSDLLSAATVDKMVSTHGDCSVLRVPGCGHAPALIDPGQTGPILAFLGSEHGAQ